MSISRITVDEHGRRPKWVLFIGSNVALFIGAVLLVNVWMSSSPKFNNRRGGIESTAIPVTLVPTETGGTGKANHHGRALSFRMTDIWESLRPWQPYIRKYSREFGVDPDLVNAVMYIESKGNPNSVSGKGAIGLMQLTPATATHLGVSDIFNPEENIKAGVKYISGLIRTYEDESSALLVYNAGAGVLDRERIPQETRRFIDQVLFLKSFLKDGTKRDDLS